jgi:RNA polymerase sigma-70 factor (ECF subfamily)
VYELRASSEDLALVQRIRAGDETAFMELVERLRPAMLRVARMYVATDAVADEVVQETWIGVLQGIDRFEGRSSLRTWIFRILANVAKTRGVRESRSVPFTSLGAEDRDEAAVPSDRFQGPFAQFPGSWSTLPEDWRGVPDERLLAAETLAVIGRAIDALPASQAAVIRMRDVLGMTSDEVRNALELSETNQRVLLHRARARVRRAVEEYVKSGREERDR